MKVEVKQYGKETIRFEIHNFYRFLVLSQLRELEIHEPNTNTQESQS